MINYPFKKFISSYPSSLSKNNAAEFIKAPFLGITPGRICLTTLPPLSLYIHFPWCVRKCPYCDFNSHALSRTSGSIHFPEIEYINALRADLEAALPLISERPVHTVFIGGGTPSLLSAQAIDRLLSDLRALLLINVDAEITLEANPGTFEAAKFASFRSSGVNRLSIGIQSFHDAHLKALGRIHNAAQCLQAVDIASLSFDNFNLDLMFALPNQTLEQCYADIETALSLAPPHLSLYQLTLEPNTYFHKYPPSLPDHDTSADMQDWIHARMRKAGYQHYEVSSYAKEHQKSRHNLNYWQFGDYLGIGAGAHSKLSFPERIVRQIRHKHPIRYLEQTSARTPIQEQHEISKLDLPFEFMLNTLRLTDGFSEHHFIERTGLTMKVIDPILTGAEHRGLIRRDQENIAPTSLGQRFLNDLQSLFLKGNM
ncbi:radical SAM family heme chaperone HemW [Candidatus Vallotia lariciata]|uniref:radical SAM family heme chaperone HemW n=1 Tax=Candidatus Vallotia laricis TaxID=2018052 RepID=UPI001D01A51E|nr:radical SAM family heme chaperone HemW [Candidatus Vallotia lariciata]UDG82910.1 Oxygen-independent coproporphyrinogen-III oxidase-like protein YqeR [Candidatus Vallotia lariciata]